MAPYASGSVTRVCHWRRIVIPLAVLLLRVGGEMKAWLLQQRWLGGNKPNGTSNNISVCVSPDQCPQFIYIPPPSLSPKPMPFRFFLIIPGHGKTRPPPLWVPVSVDYWSLDISCWEVDLSLDIRTLISPDAFNFDET